MNEFDPLRYKEMEKAAYNATAESYEKYGDPIFGPLARALLEKASLRPGETVLDVACGTGIPALDAASLVTPGGTVTGVDLAPGMVQKARAKAERRNAGNATFREADGEALPFPHESFDVVLSAMGLIHMTDRARALAEMARVLRKGGRLVLSVWGPPEKSVAVGIMAKAVACHWPPAIVPGAPTWFDFALPETLKRALRDAGLEGVEVHTIESFYQIQDGAAYWEACLGISGKLRMLLASVPPAVAAKIEESAQEAAEGFRKGNSLLLPNEQLIGLAKRPHR